MMGGHHAVSGAAAWLALASSAQIAGHPTGVDVMGLDGQQVLAGTVVATGAALLPDVDHPRATIAHSAGGMSRSLTSTVGAFAGHRGATHTPLAALAFAAGALLDTTGSIPVVLGFMALTGLALAVFGYRAALPRTVDDELVA